MILKLYMFSGSNTGGMLGPIANAIVPTVSNGLRTPDAYFRDLKAAEALPLRAEPDDHPSARVRISSTVLSSPSFSGNHALPSRSKAA